MGCRPSRHASNKIRGAWSEDSTNVTDVESTQTRPSTNTRLSATSSRSRTTDFSEFSTATGIYRQRGDIRTSKITVRLSTDGSTLEIEKCEVDGSNDCSNFAVLPRTCSEPTLPWQPEKSNKSDKLESNMRVPDDNNVHIKKNVNCENTGSRVSLINVDSKSVTPEPTASVEINAAKPKTPDSNVGYNLSSIELLNTPKTLMEKSPITKIRKEIKPKHKPSPQKKKKTKSSLSIKQSDIASGPEHDHFSENGNDPESGKKSENMDRDSPITPGIDMQRDRKPKTSKSREQKKTEFINHSLRSKDTSFSGSDTSDSLTTDVSKHYNISANNSSSPIIGSVKKLKSLPKILHSKWKSKSLSNEDEGIGIFDKDVDTSTEDLLGLDTGDYLLRDMQKVKLEFVHEDFYNGKFSVV